MSNYSKFQTTSLRQNGRLSAFLSTKTAGISGPSGVVNTWYSRVFSAGGTVNTNSLTIAQNLFNALRTESYYGKIIWLNPLLGTGINAARVPLIDALDVGASINTGFVDGDFSESTGLSNVNESAKYMNSLITPAMLGQSNNGGLGWWERNWGIGSGVEPIGCYNTANTNRFCIDGRSSLKSFRWGSPSNAAGSSTTFSNGHYYGQRSSSTSRSLYKDGILSPVESTTFDNTSGASDRNIFWMGCNESPITYWKGNCAVSYLTNGSMTSDEILAFHNLLNTYLIGPTGR